ncbi:MAG: hypothetical protein WBE76_21180 [Terracidiphilus sp.]
MKKTNKSQDSAREERRRPDDRARGILRKVLSSAIYVAIIFTASFGIALLWDWMETATGLSLSLRQIKEAAGWGITFAIGFSLGELWRQRSTLGN